MFFKLIGLYTKVKIVKLKNIRGPLCVLFVNLKNNDIKRVCHMKF